MLVEKLVVSSYWQLLPIGVQTYSSRTVLFKLILWNIYYIYNHVKELFMYASFNHFTSPAR